jgi:hypothetical protein
MKENQRASRAYRLYTDGSAIDGGVGTAAILYQNSQRVDTLRYHLGPATEHTVYEAEIVGMLLGASLLNARTPHTASSVGVDNQAVIRATQSRVPNPGGYLLDALDTELRHNHPYPG